MATRRPLTPQRYAQHCANLEKARLAPRRSRTREEVTQSVGYRGMLSGRKARLARCRLAQANRRRLKQQQAWTLLKWREDQATPGAQEVREDQEVRQAEGCVVGLRRSREGVLAQDTPEVVDLAWSMPNTR